MNDPSENDYDPSGFYNLCWIADLPIQDTLREALQKALLNKIDGEWDFLDLKEPQ